MSEESNSTYESPAVTEYGSVESITENDKHGNGDDQYSSATSLTGSIV
ncbi:lasso RiPP family leader peptide-containing protein [Natrarchaeobius halalkaliphilus]|uniref:Lasso RiPP family leader peptide-containing protein n=1 Tax=Natrarchaeobius halalkaliphilus TaxID=1679091 RepID=A0A3N6LKN6_9EURY|nr:lasso RiPP family leader peptide-containing protein [Natrarchaeobius halalkaliphilus]RQG89228.1 lasso RiPP family leader peptide-containing protein [Natrarchaeobius halalkaliphilus]